MSFGQLLKSLGGKNRQIKVEHDLCALENTCQLFRALLIDYGTRLKQIEHEMIDRCAYMEPDGQKALTTAGRILNAVNKRLKELDKCVDFKSLKALEDTREFAESPIELESDYLNQLSTERKQAPLPVRDIRYQLDYLFGQMTIIRRHQLF